MIKAINFIVLLGLITMSLLIVGCKEEPKDDLLPNYYWGEVSALKNGENWEAEPYGVAILNNSELFALVFHRFDSYGSRHESFFISYMPIQVGKYIILNDSLFKNQNAFVLSDSASSSYSTLVGGDAVGDIYGLLQTETNFIEIQSYDEHSRVVTGKFQVTFILTRDSEWTPYSPDTVRFTNGIFRTKVWDKLE